MASWVSTAVNLFRVQLNRLGSSLVQPIRNFHARDRALSFQEVNDLELAELRVSRQLREQPEVANDTVGLAFSGGGIRSATFNLGILQALAKRGYLRQIDYLSTVSGGGYVGAWLIAWIRRAGGKRVQQRLSENQQPPPPHEANRYLEPDPIRFLRQYSNYLTPRAGLLSTDTWAAVAVYLRNLTLNLVLLVASGVCALLLPDFALWFLKRGPHPPVGWLVSLATAAVVLVMAVVGTGFGALSTQSRARRDWRRHIVNHAGMWTSVPLFVAAVATTVLLGFCNLHLTTNYRPWILNGAGIYFALWLISSLTRLLSRSGEEPEPVEGEILFRTLFPPLITLLVGALQGFIAYWTGRLFQWANPDLLCVRLDGRVVALVVFGPALLVGIMLLTAIFHIGLAGRALPDANREWLARGAAVSSLVTFAWVILTSATFYGPLWMKWLTSSEWAVAEWGRFCKWLLAAAWAAITAGGIAAGHSSATHGKDGNGNGGDRFKLITRVAPPVFSAGLVLLLSFGLDAFLSRLPTRDSQPAAIIESPQHSLERLRAATREMLSASTLQQAASTVDNLQKATSTIGASGFEDLSQEHWQSLYGYLGYRLLWVMISGLLIAWILGDRVDVNEFSMHLFYRNRLTRAYLGASQSRAKATRLPDSRRKTISRCMTF